jgi:pyruvate dehydrogenase E2 component (dihydrolipoamide acetyltransferase)
MMILREKFKEINRNIGFTDIVVKACARAIEDHRIMNSRLLKESIEVLSEINIGVAMDTDKGLVVPVIKQTNRKTLSEISDELKNKAEAAKDNHLSSDDLAGGTFTVSNLGMLGITNFTAVINPPECAILAVGAIQRTFVPDNDNNPTLRSYMNMTLSFDHRIVDGAPAARFLNDVKRYIENPVTML